MSSVAKISPAFEPFLAESARDEKRDAIVIYRSPTPERTPVTARLRDPQAPCDVDRVLCDFGLFLQRGGDIDSGVTDQQEPSEAGHFKGRNVAEQAAGAQASRAV